MTRAKSVLRDIGSRVASSLAAVAVLATLSLDGPTAVRAQTSPLATGEAADGSKWAKVEVLSADREDGVLTVSVRFLAGDDSFRGKIDFYKSAEAGYETVYLVAQDKKYFALKDAEGTPLIPETFEMFIAAGGRGRAVWSGKFPAPPPEVKQVSLTLPFTTTLRGIPITDR